MSKKLAGWQMLETLVVFGICSATMVWAGFWWGLASLLPVTIAGHFVFGRK